MAALLFVKKVFELSYFLPILGIISFFYKPKKSWLHTDLLNKFTLTLTYYV